MKRYILFIITVLFTVFSLNAQSVISELDKVIFLPKDKASVYSMLNKISQKTGMLFIYDSKVINNERVVKIRAGKRTVNEAIREIVGNKSISIEKIGNHLLITESQPVKSIIPESKGLDYITLEGILSDMQTNMAIPYTSVGLAGTSIGTITNLEGAFKLNIPDSIHNGTVYFSHLGYEPQTVSVSDLKGKILNIPLMPKVISLHEVVIRAINPIKVLDTMIMHRNYNYSDSPVYLTTFYREGICYNGNFRSLTEAVFKIYKTSYKSSFSNDQVKLLKMRRISNYNSSDTLIARMSSGIDASLNLDLIKSLPDFLTPNSETQYTYSFVESTVIDGRNVDVISFQQKKYVREPLYCGKIYIDSSNKAMIRVEMEIYPEKIKESTSLFVSKQAQQMKLTARKVNYDISYKQYNGKYYINHIKGNLYFKVKKRHHLFGTSELYTWFEMIPCKIDTVDVVRFDRSERIPTKTIFSDTKYNYDPDFWGEYNSIPLETTITDIIKKISPKIEVIKQ